MMALQINNENQKIIEFAANEKCEFVDLKFVDLPGAWQHLTLSITQLENGVGFDGSSLRGFKNLHNSDMILLPDPTTAFVDPIYSIPTLSFICDIIEPLSGEKYARDPRLVAKKAESYLRNSGIADISYWGPELEFFIFDGVRFDSNSHESFYHINSKEGIWNSGNDYEDNNGYFIRRKEGYFSTPPADRMSDLRTIIVKAMIRAGVAAPTLRPGQTNVSKHQCSLI
jgi:glutamine synthetase